MSSRNRSEDGQHRRDDNTTRSPRRSKITKATCGVAAVALGTGMFFAVSGPAGADTSNFGVTASASTIKDSNGFTWDAKHGFTGGRAAAALPKGETISGTKDPELYTNGIYDMSAFKQAVPNGSYTVTVLMSENAFHHAGTRVFDVTAEGKTVLSNVDIFKAAGHAHAYNRSFTTTVSDGTLNLGFVAHHNYPLVMGIRVTPIAPAITAPTPVKSTTPVAAPTTKAAAPTSAAPTTKAAAPSTSTVTSAAPTSKATSAAPTTTVSTAAPTTKASSTTAAPTSASSSSSTTSTPVTGGLTPVSQSAGSLPVGSAAYAVPAGATFVSTDSGSDSNSGTISSPLKTIKAALSKTAAGGTIVLRGGTYHEFNTVTKAVTIQAYPHEAVWLDGSVPVTNWKQSGKTWVSTGWTAEFDNSKSFIIGSTAGNFINPDYPMASYPDELFVDGTQLIQVASNVTPAPGQFSVNYATDTLTMGTNPTGNDVRAADLSQALVGAVGGLNLKGIGIRRFATSLPQMGAVYLSHANNTVENVVFSDIATQAIALYKGNDTLNHLTVLNSGMCGISGTQADGSVVENSLVQYSNREHFNSAPASAAIKISRSRGLTFTDNVLTNNYDAPGIWLDESVVGFTITGNRVENNGVTSQIQAELSDTGIIANNEIANGQNGILIFDTGNVKIYNNTISGSTRASIALQQDERRETTPGNNHDPRQPIPDPTDPWLTRNITVANNVFGWNGGSYGFQIYAIDTKTHIAASDMNITIVGNLFHTRIGNTDTMVAWGNSNAGTTRYESPAALDSGVGKGWSNQQVPTVASITTSFISSLVGTTSALPSDVAAAIGVSTNTKHLGDFLG